MGLDINILTNVELIEDYQEDGDYDFWNKQSDPIWYKTHTPNLVPEGYYRGEFLDGDYPRYAYSYHSHFRKFILEHILKLDHLVEENQYGGIKWDDLIEEKNIPFYKFIHFSDCEGGIDWEIAKEILEDFEKYNNKIIPYHSIRDVNYNRLARNYDMWQKTFKDAVAEKGVIVFC